MAKIENRHEFLETLKGKKVKRAYTNNKVFTIIFTDGTKLKVQSDKIIQRPFLDLKW